jgi:thiol-disulfide isomerase/thioredoxin
MQKNLYRGVLGIVLGLLVGITAFAGAQEESSMDGGAMASGYVDYDEEAFGEAADQTRVYFFHAGWCPSCRALDRDITENVDRIPTDAVIFKTDYDSSRALKTRYGVTYQHTFVVVDAEGELVHRWTGGNFDDLLRELADL